MSLISSIHVAKAKLGMDDDTYRAFLEKTVGKTSCKGMTANELGRVLSAFEAVGFKKNTSDKAKKLARDPQAKKIRALWLMLAETGVVRNRAEYALESFVRRICGQSLDTASVKQGQAVIECLKQRAERESDKRILEAFRAIMDDDKQKLTVVMGKIIAEVQGGIQ